MIVRNHNKIIEWLTSVIDSRMLTVLEENSVGWGENGHIIELSHNCPFICEIDQKWNNTYDLLMTDFIRHHNSGPLRTSLIDNLAHRMIFCLSYRILLLISKLKGLKKLRAPINDLDVATLGVTTLYPSFLSNKNS